MDKYEIGEVWWTQFPFEDIDEDKRRPAIVVDDSKIAVLAMMVTSVDKDNLYSIKIDDWDMAGLPKQSWARIDRIIKMDEWRMEKKIGDLSERDLNKENIDKNISVFLKRNVTTTYVTSAKHCKYSVSDEVYKCYNHTLYKLSLDDIPDYMSGEEFILDGKTCSWKSVYELEKDNNTMGKNDDIIAFVKKKCK